jgi:hypothetical protein
MARKKSARSSSAKKKPAAKAAKARPRSAGGKKRGSGQATEVERRWADYLEQRTALEESVAAVQAASEALSSARQIEAERRKQFDEQKRALEQLLEVEAASARRPDKPERKPLEFPGPAPAQPAKATKLTPG